LEQNTVWDAPKSPYVLTGPVLIPKGVSVVVEPGVEILLNRSFVQVDGTLQVLGTSERPVVIHDSAASGEDSIIFSGSSSGWNESTRLGSIVQFAVLQGQTSGSGLVRIDNNASPKIVDSVLINRSGTALYITGGSPFITSNRISGRIGVFVTGGSPVINANTIEGCQGCRYGYSGGPAVEGAVIERNIIRQFEVGIFVADNSKHARINYNLVSNNGTGIAFNAAGGYPLQVEIKGNSIHSNTLNATASLKDVDMTLNWWGTTDPPMIEAALVDAKKDFRFGKIAYRPYLAQPSPHAPK
jgi:hypothetical protein